MNPDRSAAKSGGAENPRQVGEVGADMFRWCFAAVVKVGRPLSTTPLFCWSRYRSKARPT